MLGDNQAEYFGRGGIHSTKNDYTSTAAHTKKNNTTLKKWGVTL